MTTTTTRPSAAADAPAPCGRHRRPGRLLGATAVAVAGAALIGTGAFSSWNATTTVDSGPLAAGTVTPAMVDANGGQFTTGVANLPPGDYFFRYVDVRNDGSRAQNYTGTVTTAGDLAGQVVVEVTTCSVAWTTVSGASTCTGTATVLNASGTPTTAVPMTVGHGSILNGAADAQHVRYRFTFSATAPSTLQGKTGSITVAVSNTAVGGTDRTTG